MASFHSIKELVQAAESEGKKISDIVLKDQSRVLEASEEKLIDKMSSYFDVMQEGTKFRKDGMVKSVSGLTGGEGWKLMKYNKETNGGICGSFFTAAVSRALSVSNCNAHMGKIVATPTAGSCGILPGCLVSLYEDKGIEKEKLVRSMFTASAFGMVIAENACIAGATGGCQAECGSASGMAAAAITEVMGGSPQSVADACGMALVNQLGLVCDPVAGLVEIPCIKRNASGTAIALTAASMALAGIPLYIPVDQCILAMKQIGDSMQSAYKETARGGLAASKRGMELKKQVFHPDKK